MKHLPEINHCRPNAKAYWCSECKAHNPYTYSITDAGSEKFACVGCDSHMFRPAATCPWMHSMGCAFPLLMIALSIFFSFHPRAAKDLGGEGLVYCMIGLGGFFGLIGASMFYHMRKWVGWSFIQHSKTTAQLDEEALSHTVQPRYEDDGSFADWASQFLPEKEVDALIEKYHSQSNSE